MMIKSFALAATATAAIATAAPAFADQTQDPFVATQNIASTSVPVKAIVIGGFAILAITAASGTH